jgi:hypothetical protein
MPKLPNIAEIVLLNPNCLFCTKLFPQQLFNLDFLAIATSGNCRFEPNSPVFSPTE